MKTTLRYLLILVAMVSVLSVSAQNLAQRPEAQMQSTSVMIGSGSTLPQAAANGAVLTGSHVGTYTPVKAHPGSIRRDPGDGEDDGWEDEPEPENPGEINPIGDAMWPLALCALAYLILRVVRARKRMHA